MLRRWTESVVVELGLDAVRARRRSWRGRVVAAAGRSHAAAEDAIAAAGVSFDAVLGEVLAGQPGRSRSLDVILDNAWTCIDVVAGRFGGMTKAQIQRIARGCVDEIAPDHEVQWQLQRGAATLLIAAMPRALLVPLGEAARRHGLDLRSVTPRVVWCWNGARERLGGDDVVFACMAQGFVACLHARRGVVEATAQAAVPDGDAAAAALDLQFDRLLALRGLPQSAARRFVVMGALGAGSPRWDVVQEDAS